MATAQAPDFNLNPGSVSFQPGQPGSGLRTQVPVPPGFRQAGPSAQAQAAARTALAEDDGAPVRLSSSAFDPETAERVPAFEIDGEIVTMLADPPALLVLQAIELDRQQDGQGNTYLMAAMLGTDGYEKLINNVTEWADFRRVQQRVLNRAMAKVPADPNQ